MVARVTASQMCFLQINEDRKVNTRNALLYNEIRIKSSRFPVCLWLVAQFF